MQISQEQVREFHRKAGAVINDKPTNLDCETIQLRINLIQEELEEYQQAAFQHNVVETADALGDLLYVVLGAAVSHGIEIVPIFEEIHRSNMTKFIDGHLREDGKWVKGPSYTPANLAPLIQLQLL